MSETVTSSDDTSLQGITIDYKEIPDANTQAAVKRLLEEREQLKLEMAEVTKTVKELNDREIAKLYTSKRTAKMAELNALDSRLATVHKDETDIDKISLLVDTAKSYKDNFASYQEESDDNTPKIVQGYVDPNTKKVV